MTYADGFQVAVATTVDWSDRVARAVEQVGTPCYVSAWEPVTYALRRLEQLDAAIPLRPWLSFKTHPLPALALEWIRLGHGVEVVSERELSTLIALSVPTDQLLINGVAKHTWLRRHPIPRLRVHFDSLAELDDLLPTALDERWRVGVRLQVPDQRDARDETFGDQFGMSRSEALTALGRLQEANAQLESVHFHLGQHTLAAGAYLRAVHYAADVCDEAGFAPFYLDCGGALPAPGDDSSAAALLDLEDAVCQAPRRFRRLEEIWVENGRFVTEGSTALAVRVVDVKDREDSRYLICDGGRTNHALAADTRQHPILVLPARPGRVVREARLTTVCGPTCMSDDRLGRWMLPASVDVGDIIVWLDAGAYHLPWETRFSHGLCAVVWFNADERLTVAREREGIEAHALRGSVAQWQ
jgi:diaminopimelate decarboxylase